MSTSKSRKTTAKKAAAEDSVEREMAVARADDQSMEGAASIDAKQNGVSEGGAWDERIRQRAFELYCTRGRDDGSELDDWFEAERQVRFQTSATERPVEADVVTAPQPERRSVAHPGGVGAHSATEGSAPRVLEMLGDDAASEVRR
jgi:hypothetical protein